MTKQASIGTTPDNKEWSQFVDGYTKEDHKEFKEMFKIYKADCSTTKITEEQKQVLKSYLQISSFVECRLNTYWKLPACACHSYTIGKDLHHFSYPAYNGVGFLPRMPMAMKSAELFVTWVHAVHQSQCEHEFTTRACINA